MKIGVTSQNFRTITGHAGKTRRFLILGQDEAGKPIELERLDLPKEMSLHEYHGDSHPIFQVDLLVCGSCGKGFIHEVESQLSSYLGYKLSKAYKVICELIHTIVEIRCDHMDSSNSCWRK